MKKSLQNFLKKQKKAAANVPRELSAIQADFSKYTSDLGQIQYQIFVLNAEQERLNMALAKVNTEAAARQQLDKQNTAAALTEVPNV